MFIVGKLYKLDPEINRETVVSFITEPYSDLLILRKKYLLFLGEKTIKSRYNCANIVGYQFLIDGKIGYIPQTEYKLKYLKEIK